MLSRVRAIVVLGLLALAVPAAASAHASTPAAVATVNVTITDSSLRVTPTMPSSGPTTFVVVNHGKKPHVLLVKGPGVSGVRTAKIMGGHSAKLTVTLRPGAYALSDPVGLGAYSAFFLDVIKSTSVTGSGSGNAPAPPVNLPPMCGMTYTP